MCNILLTLNHLDMPLDFFSQAEMACVQVLERKHALPL